MKKTVFQLVRYGIVGGMNTVVDALSYTIITRTSSFFEEHFLLAATLSFVVAGVVGFFLHKHWTFKDKQRLSHTQVLRFYTGAVSAFACNQAILWALVSAETHDIIAKLIASVSAGFLNFTIQKFWTFPTNSSGVQSNKNEVQ